MCSSSVKTVISASPALRAADAAFMPAAPDPMTMTLFAMSFLRLANPKAGILSLLVGSTEKALEHDVHHERGDGTDPQQCDEVYPCASYVAPAEHGQHQ